jgi:predicted RNA-binding Zn-ribbon protein involved in translation (DUF1610 family)
MTPATESCPSCGHVIPGDVQFCPECGAIVVRSGEKREDRLAQSFERPPGMQPPSSGSPPTQKRPLLALIPAIGLVVAALVAYLLWPSAKPQSIPVPGEPATEPTIAAIAEAPTPKPAARPPAPPPPAAAIPPPSAEAPVASRPPAPREEVEEPREPEREPPPREERRADDLEEESSTVSRSRPEPPVEAPRMRPGGPARGDDESTQPAVRWYRVRFRAPLFAQPSETSAILSYLPAGTRIRVTRRTEGFLAVESVTGKQPGFVSRDDAVPESVAGAR